MKNYFRNIFVYIFLIAFCFILNNRINGQNISSKDIVNVKVKSNKTLNKNDTINVDVVLNIKDGWHINANKPLDDYLTATVLSLKDTSNIHIAGLEYPVPILTKLNFSQTQLALYEDQATIKLKLKVKKSFKKSKLKLNGTVQYQPCNDQTCLFPVRKQFSSELHFKNK
jgi:DsbC/DsbD-like thiol-disulfide interchange protein